MEELPPTGLFENKTQCSNEQSTNEIIDDDLVLIEGYHLCKDRMHGHDGGVCAFVSADIPCRRRWVWLRPVRFPRKISGLIFAILYNPSDTPTREKKIS